jgi:hypothetical protein
MTVADPTRFTAPAALDRLQRIALVVGIVALVACGVGVAVDLPQFLSSWLLGVTYWLGISIGCLALAMIHHLTGGDWGVPVRRVFEAAAAVLPLVAVLFLPVLFGAGDLYLWARPEAAADPVLAHKAPFLNEPFFRLRFVLYFLVWIGLAAWLRRLSLAQDRAPDPSLNKRMQAISAPGLVVWALVTTFAYVDWLMSLEPHWFSTIYGVYFFGGTGLSSMAFLIVVAVVLGRRAPMAGLIGRRHFHDWGKLMFAFVLLWTYFAVSQFIIIWSGNLPEEIEWYLHRMSHGWQYVGIGLALGHFALPFALLLSRDLKRNMTRLAGVAVFVLLMRWVDHLWQIAPVFHPEHVSVHWLDVAAPLAVGGLWLAAFVQVFKRRPIVPINDPYLEESLGDEAHH